MGRAQYGDVGLEKVLPAMQRGAYSTDTRLLLRAISVGRKPPPRHWVLKRHTARTRSYWPIPILARV